LELEYCPTSPYDNYFFIKIVYLDYNIRIFDFVHTNFLHFKKKNSPLYLAQFLSAKHNIEVSRLLVISKTRGPGLEVKVLNKILYLLTKWLFKILNEERV
jgi:hypothetical protein